jgi:hypothetical protein
VAAPNPDFVGYEAGPDTVRKQCHGARRASARALLRTRGKERPRGLLMVQGATADHLEHAVSLRIRRRLARPHALPHLSPAVSPRGTARAQIPVLVIPTAIVASSRQEN